MSSGDVAQLKLLYAGELPDTDDDGLSTGAIVGISIGALVVVLLAVYAFVGHGRGTARYAPVGSALVGMLVQGISGDK
jgi:hypothetical protein